MKKAFLSHLAAFACGVLLVCGVSMTAPHRVSSGVYGDVNGDGVVDVDDLNEVVNVMLGKPHGGERAILVSEESLTFTGEVDGVYTQTLTVGGDNLHGAVSAIVMGGDGAFGVAPNTLSLEQVQRGVELTVTYAPTSAGTHTARLLLTSEGAPSVTVTLTGTASGPAPTTQTFTVGGVSFKMIAVEGGTFTMGATAEQGNEAWDDEKPAHQVTLSSYSIGETEVTQALWVAVMGSNPSRFTGNLQRPVEWVSWDDCQAFITKLNQLTGAKFRLPTEAEWEYAARGGNKSKGYKYAGSNTIGDVAWYDVNAYDGGSGNPNYGTHAVAAKSPNELGLYDMSGNVYEWCQDWFSDSYYSSSPSTNPTGPASGSRRVDRGGSWNDLAESCRVSYRKKKEERNHDLFGRGSVFLRALPVKVTITARLLH